MIRQLRDTLEAGDAAAFPPERATHSRVRCGSLAHHDAADLAWQLELLGKEGDLEAAGRQVDLLIAAVDSIVLAVRSGPP